MLFDDAISVDVIQSKRQLQLFFWRASLRYADCLQLITKPQFAAWLLATVLSRLSSPLDYWSSDVLHPTQGCSGGDGVPHFFRQGGRVPHSPPHFFGLKFVQRLVHCCNWLLTEKQCKIISVQHVYVGLNC